MVFFLCFFFWCFFFWGFVFCFVIAIVSFFVSVLLLGFCVFGVGFLNNIWCCFVRIILKVFFLVFFAV